MKAITLAFVLVFGMFLFSSCNKTQDTTSNEIKQNVQTEQKETPSQDEMTSKEKAGEETKTKEVSNKDAKLETASFKCETMTCTGCEQTITNKVKKMDGVEDVKADYKTKSVEVTFASNRTSKDDIAKTIEASGYKCEVNN
ncbi:MAG: heavy-metal-associated domain-containing protein [Ignavibacteriae bacterium]|nr:heavy-metal-associated domain-containing protein [Ignavibacteriota bacterium]